MKFVALCLAPLFVVCMGCAHQEAFEDAKREVVSQDEVIRELRKRNEDLLSSQRALETDLKAARAEADSLRKGKDVMDQDVASMKERLASFESRFGEFDKELGVHTKAHAEGVAVEVAETVLFAPGKSVLTERGKILLKKLADRIKDHPGNIRVEGHTDDQPVVLTAKDYPLGNLQLSGRRSLVVADFLIKEGGLPAEKVSYAGYGEHHPLVKNASAESRARNRRVEIVLLAGPMNR